MMKKYYKRIGKNIKFINIDNIKNNKIFGISCNYIIIDDYINEDNKMIKINGNVISGNREKILEILKKKANPNCNTCYGRGHIGYKEDKNGSRIYIPCGKCIEGNRQIPKSKGLSFIRQKMGNNDYWTRLYSKNR